MSSAITRKVLRGQMYSESDLTEMLLQVAQGLEYIHSKRLVHLDIKPGKGTFCLPVPMRTNFSITDLQGISSFPVLT